MYRRSCRKGTPDVIIALDAVNELSIEGCDVDVGSMWGGEGRGEVEEAGTGRASHTGP